VAWARVLGRCSVVGRGEGPGSWVGNGNPKREEEGAGKEREGEECKLSRKKSSRIM